MIETGPVNTEEPTVQSTNDILIDTVATLNSEQAENWFDTYVETIKQGVLDQYEVWNISGNIAINHISMHIADITYGLRPTEEDTPQEAGYKNKAILHLIYTREKHVKDARHKGRDADKYADKILKIIVTSADEDEAVRKISLLERVQTNLTGNPDLEVKTPNYGPKPEQVGVSEDDVQQALRHTSTFEEASEFVLKYLDGVREMISDDSASDAEGVAKRNLIDLIYTLGPNTNKTDHPSFRSARLIASAMEDILPTDISFYYSAPGIAGIDGTDEGHRSEDMPRQNHRYLGILEHVLPQSNGTRVA